VLVSLGGYAPGAAGLKWVGLGAVVAGAPPVLRKAWAALRARVFGIHFLMAIASVGAVLLGEVVDAGILVCLFGLSEWLESKTLAAARNALEAVMALRPETAEVVSRGGAIVQVEDVRVGEVVAIRPGAKVPVDGTVVKGSSTVDESSLTGESRGVPKAVGSEVFAGTLNQGAYLEVEATAPSSESTVARLAALVEQASMQRSATERLVERVAKRYTPVILLAALLLATIPVGLAAGDWDAQREWLYLACTLLVIGCPCALVLSTPATVISGLAAAAHKGVLVKGGQHLEALGAASTVAFDKTGTLTEGRYRLHEVAVARGKTRGELLFWTASVESQSSHPLAPAILAAARAEGVAPSEDVDGYETLAGRGVFAEVDGRRVHVGSTRMAEGLGWTAGKGGPLAERARALEAEGFTVCWAGDRRGAFGLLAVADAARKGARELVAGFQRAGVRCTMLTGDNAGAAKAVADQLGLESARVHAGLTPEDKLERVKGLKEEKGGRERGLLRGLLPDRSMVAMVGDGVNDAPALAAADVGVAMGAAGTPVAMETADVVLFSHNLQRLQEAFALGRTCRAKILQNIVFSIVLKAAIIGLTLTGHVGLIGAVLSDVVGAMGVIGNGMSVMYDPMATRRRLRKLKQDLLKGARALRGGVRERRLVKYLEGEGEGGSCAKRGCCAEAAAAKEEEACCSSGKCGAEAAAAKEEEACCSSGKCGAEAAAAKEEEACCSSGKCGAEAAAAKEEEACCSGEACCEAGESGERA